MQERDVAMKRWYALYTKAHKEQQVHDLLRDRGFAVFLPQLRVFKKGRVVQTREPLFPCYLFAEFDLRETGLSTVQWTQGLRRVVSFCNEPAIVDDEVRRYLDRQRARACVARSARPASTRRGPGRMAAGVGMR